MRNRSVVALLLTGRLAIVLFAFGGTGLLETLTGSTTPAPGPSAAPVPGAPASGARRIIAGSAGEKYYTQDHYASF
ncbi:MAG TPA: hypothetical protein DEP82_01705 [Arthrobacter bacterium]|nr:hypothetical protein [Arthrobacter sp.]HAP91782.1 hypothetical protein [Arthrobacter sp.]HCB56674.1 hypothetical protein [Arthrobacter sp.]